MTATTKITAEKTLALVASKLDYWEKNLRANLERCSTSHYEERIQGELYIIDAVRELLS
jgi:hypothetical protein